MSEELQTLQNRTPVMDPKSSRAYILELEAKLAEYRERYGNQMIAAQELIDRILELEAQIERLNRYRPVVEFAVGRDEDSIDHWTITENVMHLSHIGCCGRRVFKRTVLQGPWEEVDV